MKSVVLVLLLLSARIIFAEPLILKETLSVNGPEIKMEDLFGKSEFENIILSKSPVSKNKLIMTAKDIEDKYFAKTGGKLKILGAKKVIIFRENITYDLSAMKNKILDLAIKEYGYKKGVLVEVVSTKVSLPKGENVCSPIKIRPKKYSSSGYVWINCTNYGRHYATFKTKYKFYQHGEIIIAKRNLTPGDRLTKDDYRVKSGNILDYRNDVLKLVSKDLIVKNNINLGNAIYRSDVEIEPTISIGDELALKLMSSGISIKTLGKAITNGYLGKVLRVEKNGAVLSAILKESKDGDLFGEVI